MRPRVAVLHHPASFFPPGLSQEVGDHAELIWVVDESCANDVTSRLLKRLGPVVDIAGLEVDQAARVLAGLHLDGIVSFVDDHIEMAAALATRLDLRYHTPEVAERAVDKRRQREVFQRAGIPGPNLWPVPADLGAAQAIELSRRIKYPAVLKPAHGSGSRHMHLVTGPAEFLSLLEANAGAIALHVEEYVPDDPAWSHWYANYFSVESVVSAGRISHVTLTGRFPLAEPFRETGNFVPGILERELEQPVFRMVDDAIGALGITDSVVHTEIKLSADGPKLIEVNGRLGGRPPFVLGSVSDVNLFRAACDIAVGTPVIFGSPATCRGVGFWYMEQPPMSATSVASIVGFDDLASLPGVDLLSLNRSPGEPIDWRDGTSTRVLTVRGSVDDYDALAKTIGSIRETVKIEYEPPRVDLTDR